jgi:hypothetical protein
MDRNRDRPSLYIRDVKLVQKQSLLYYRGGTLSPFLQIFTSWPKVVPTAKSELHQFSLSCIC